MPLIVIRYFIITSMLRSIFLVLLGAIPAFGQSKKEFREQTFAELVSIIENPFEFLGKTDSAVVAAGRPANIVGGDQWEVTISTASEENDMDSKLIIIGTGHGALMLMVSKSTSLIYTLFFVPHRRSQITGADIIIHLQGRFKFDKEWRCTFETDNGKVGMMALAGALHILAFPTEGDKLRFQ